MSTLTLEQQRAIATFLDGKHIPSGIGSPEEACSIAAINLALTGELTDNIPVCMSFVIGRWIIGIQDRMPDAMRNSTEWRALLPFAAGTGRDFEKERLAIIMDWMWGAAHPLVQPYADSHGYGPQWLAMTTERTKKAAGTDYDAAAYATAATHAAAYDATADATDAAYAIAAAAYAAAYAAIRAAAYDATADATDAAYAIAAAWGTLAPIALLQRLIEVGE